MYLAASDGGSTVLGFAYLILIVIAYWAPTIIAATRHVQGLGQVVILNIFGFTVIGWVAALYVAFRHVPPAADAGQTRDTVAR